MNDGRMDSTNVVCWMFVVLRVALLLCCCSVALFVVALLFDRQTDRPPALHRLRTRSLTSQ